MIFGSIVRRNLLFNTKKSFRRFINIPAKGLVRLENTKVLKISGKDAPSFINGLTTIKLLPQHLKKNQTTISNSDLNNETIVKSINFDESEIQSSNWGILNESEDFDPENPNELPFRLGIRRDGRYGLILRSNGRVFSDVFIYPTPFVLNEQNVPECETPCYLIEILNKSQHMPIKMMLNLHKLKSDIKIEEVNVNSFFYFNDTDNGLNIYDSLIDLYFSNSNSKNPQTANLLANKFLSDKILINENFDKSSILGFAIDQRIDYFGYRFLINSSSENLLQEINDEKLVYPPEVYRNRRIHNGIVEASDFGKISSLPFECNVDWMRGINFEKGCYMGQELTIRTWSKDSIIRRVLPIKFDSIIPDILPDSKLDLKAIETESDESPNSESAENQQVYNPFGGSANVRSRKDVNKVGTLLINDGEYGLARIDKKYFDWESEVIKKVKIVFNENEYIATIDSSIWN